MRGDPRGDGGAVVHLPAKLLGRLIQILFRGIMGPGSNGRRQRIAVEMARALHERGDELTDETILLLTAEIVAALNEWSRKDAYTRRAEFGFDEHGALCWTPQTLAQVLGFDAQMGLRRLKSWRQRGYGPRFIKLGMAPQSPVLYPVRTTVEWLDAQGTPGEST